MEDFKASEFGGKNADYFKKNLKTFDDQEASHRWVCPFIVWKIGKVHILLVHSLGLTPWNLSCFNSNLMIPDFPHNMKIRLANWNFCLVRPDVAKLLSCRLFQFRLGQSYSYAVKKVWYHQNWIRNNLGFMVLIQS